MTHAVALPRSDSIDDARHLAEIWLRFDLSDRRVHRAFLEALAPVFAGLPSTGREENIQARTEGRS